MTHLKKKAKWQKHQLLIFSQIANFDFNNAMSPKSFCKSDWRTLLNSWGCTLENFHFHNIRLVRLVKNSDLVQNPCLLAWLDKAKNRFSHFLKKKKKKVSVLNLLFFWGLLFHSHGQGREAKDEGPEMNESLSCLAIYFEDKVRKCIYMEYLRRRSLIWSKFWRRALLKKSLKRHVYLTLCTVFENHR